MFVVFDSPRRLSDDERLHTTAENADSSNVTTAIPDGGPGWTIVAACSVITFWFNGWSGAWGVLQTALLSSSLSTTTPATMSFVGTLSIGICVAFGLFNVRAMLFFGARNTALFGMLLLGVGLITAGFTTANLGGLFGTAGALTGVGSCFLYGICNILPTQYFSSKLGLANGLVKAGGGLGGTVLSLSLDALIRHVGIAWSFRIIGILTLATGLPAAWLIKEREGAKLRKSEFVEWSMFRSVPFTAVFIAASLATFALFVPPFFLPLFAKSIGLSSSTGAGLVAGFALCTTTGRLIAGPLCDKIGPVNMFLITMLLNAVSMLAIWPVSSTLAPLIIFAMLNGVANGAFFTTMPTVVGTMFGPGRAAVAMSMAITGWTGGYVMGAPIAGYLLQAAGGKVDGGVQGVEVYRPAIFYAGGVALVSSFIVLIARVAMDRKIVKRM
ncbi:MFS general substrate transporter [Mytilinidion resinicola]|uniref:MFS general substrate transporter n=1 Tax=Mytilinidion resinicola TaxID=574789 RepID=A0A6A6Y119_9PEZI|nr:MFS general substrate transporter [Mytilinidion resinicola]KAF2802213.1 MFS general substrate transporter [Mytilinidion resinicola]